MEFWYSKDVNFLLLDVRALFVKGKIPHYLMTKFA